MDALVMCGGASSRLDAPAEKPLFEIAGRSMVDRVLEALHRADAVADVHAAVSPQTPETRAHVADREEVTVVETPGEGYVDDLEVALDVVGRPALTVAADLPLLAPDLVERAIAVRSNPAGAVRSNSADVVRPDPALAGGSDAPRDQSASVSVSVCVPVVLKERLGVSVDTAFDGLAPTGVNVVDTGQDIMYTSYDARLAVNVNRLEDATIATELVGEDGV